jgi:phage terminase large subunit-like protein
VGQAEAGYVRRSLAYAQAVVAGEIIACKWVKAACSRQLDDLKRWQGKRAAPWQFNIAAAERVCAFIELMPHIKGPKAGTLIVLEDWQCFILTTIFGWLKPDGQRRFRRVYIEVPRGNAKSTLSSTVALYMLALDGEGGADCYSLATTREQARIVFGDAKHMALKSPRFRKAFGVDVLAHSVVQPSSASKLMALAAEGSTLDGLNIHFGCVDELHAHKTRTVYDVVETGTGKRTNSLLWVITTAGHDRAGICYELRTYLTKVLDRRFSDDTQFGVIYTIDDGDDWTSEAALVKANPNWDVSVMPEVVRALGKKATQMAAATNNYLTKHLNIWVNADTAWMDMRAWDRCADPALQIDNFRKENGYVCTIGLDLASKVDVAAKTYTFSHPDQPGHVWVFGRYYLPQLAIDTSKNSQYAGWVREQRITVTPGSVTDYDQIEVELLDDRQRYNVREVPYDPYQATQLATHMLKARVPMVEVRQIVGNMSEPMKKWESLVLEGKLHHDGDPVLGWMVSNVVAHIDKKDNIYPNKELPENKIDGVVAGIMALGRLIQMKPKAEPRVVVL